MASAEQVKRYLAYWFQLGKPAYLRNGQEVVQPQPVVSGDRYSADFEQCWQRLRDPSNGDCYLEGMEQTIAELLTDAWEISDCARCSMPVPLFGVGMQSLSCPCNDLSSWPNLDLPLPRSPVNSTAFLDDLRDRLREGHEH
ncbi:MAG: hypothetical protein HC890_19690 [Chloroflexaceae bacterium]|nr:hypothetical protein [Chloroflexaceae bacterium]